MKYLMIFFFVLCFSMFSLNAQITCSGEICPTGYAAAGPVQITIGSCVYDVCYCWVRNGNTVNLWMDPVINIASGGEGCFPYDGHDYAALMRTFVTHIIQYNPDELDWPACPPCIMIPPPPPPPNVFIVEYWSACYRDDDSSTRCLQPGHGTCSATYSVCCVNGNRTVTYVSSIQTSEDCPEGCSPICNP